MTQFGIEESSVVCGVDPCDRVVLAHWFASSILKELTHRFVTGFIHTQQNLKARFARYAFRVIRPVRLVSEFHPMPFDGRMILGLWVDEDFRFHKFGVTIKITPSQSV